MSFKRKPENVKKGDWYLKKFWVQSGLNAKAYQLQFKMQGDKVKYDTLECFPISIMGCEFGSEIS